jgi:hypothetical protein
MRMWMTLGAVTLAATAAMPVVAQDVVVMRRVIAPPNPTVKAPAAPARVANCTTQNSTFIYSGGALPPVQYITSVSLADAKTKALALCEATKGVTACMLAYDAAGKNEVYPFTKPPEIFSGSQYARYYSGTCSQI